MTRFLTCLVFLLIAAPAGAHSLFALVDTGELYVSADQGASWSVRSALPVSDAVGLVAGTTSARLFLASETGLVYRSMDAGVNWTATGSVTSDDVVDVTMRSDGTLLVLTASGTLWASSDEGSTFSALGALTGSNFKSLAVRHNGSLLALTRTGEIEESTDLGGSWTVKGSIPVSDAVAIRTLQSVSYVLTGTGLVFQSLDGGATWITTGSISQVHMRAMTQAVDHLAAITMEGEVASSADGSDWTWVGAVNQLSVTALANDTPYVVGLPDEPLPARFPVFLAPPSPNPLRAGSALAIHFELKEADRVRVRLIDIRGREVSSLEPASFDSGEHVLAWPARSLAPGLYVLELVTSAARRSAKVTVLN